jgi:hypothetical protein
LKNKRYLDASAQELTDKMIEDNINNILKFFICI